MNSPALIYHSESSLPDPRLQPGLQLIEFGIAACPHCLAAAPMIDAALAGQACSVLRIEDGRGCPLGRHFRVRLWPTLILLRDGAEIGRLVRPASSAEVTALLAACSASA